MSTGTSSSGGSERFARLRTELSARLADVGRTVEEASRDDAADTPAVGGSAESPASGPQESSADTDQQSAVARDLSAVSDALREQAEAIPRLLRDLATASGQARDSLPRLERTPAGPDPGVRAYGNDHASSEEEAPAGARPDGVGRWVDGGVGAGGGRRGRGLSLRERFRGPNSRE